MNNYDYTIRYFLHRLQQLVNDDGEKNIFIEGTKCITRREFFDLACRINALIRQRGITGAFLPIVLPDSAAYIAADCGIWMSGNASVHLSNSYPADRIDYVAKDCDAPFLIDQTFIETACNISPAETMADRTPEQDCAMFYTSGSTGNPKGVLHSDRSFTHCLWRSVAVSEFTADDVFGNVAPFYFIAVMNIFESIYIGATIDVIKRETTTDIVALRTHLIEHNVTATFVSPSLLSVLDLSGLPLKHVRTGSERVTMLSSTPECQLLNFYGQTEQAGCTLSYLIEKPYDNTPLGKPLPELKAVILDENGKEMIQGEEGELCFTGIIPCKYYKDPQKTAELMRDGVFHTGDIFRMLPSGDLLFVNRKDWMVKINGQRVEPGEVETAMRKINGVNSAIVKGFTSDGTNRQYLCGYYIADGDIQEEQIRTELGKLLPEYMVPTYFVRMTEFPKNANGKLDRKSLLSPEDLSKDREYVAPTNSVEKMLCDGMEQVLGIKPIGIDDDFILLGGDSIRIMKLQQKFNEQNAEGNHPVLSNTIINQGRTARKIAEMLNEATDLKFTEQSDYPLNDMQNFYFLFSMLQPKEAVSNLPMLYELAHTVDLEKLAHAIEVVVANHKAFATKLSLPANGSWWKKIMLSNSVLTKLCLLPGWVKGRQYYDASFKYKQVVEEMRDRDVLEGVKSMIVPFDLLNEPLFHIRLIKTERSRYLFVDMSHIICDGGSMDVFLDDIEAAYRQQPLKSEDWTLYHAVMSEKQFQNSPSKQKAIDWYKEKLKGVPSNVFPKPDLSSGEKGIKMLLQKLSMTGNEFKDIAARLGCSSNVFATAAFAYLLGRTAGNVPQVPLSLAYSGREDYRTDRTVGMLSHGIFLNARYDEGMTVSQFVDEVKDYMLTGMNNCFIPITAFMKMGVKMQKTMPFMYQGERTMSPMIGGDKARNIPVDIESKEGMPMAVHFYITDGQPEMMILYHSDMYSEKYIKNFAESYRQVLLQFGKCNNLKDIKLITV